AIDAFGGARVEVQTEYITRAIVQRRPLDTRMMILRDFLALPSDRAETRQLVVAEFPTPPELREHISFRWAKMAGAPLEDMYSSMFAAHQGHFAHFHYDLDGRAVFLTQVFGRKRVVCLPANRGQWLLPIPVQDAGSFSAFFVENMSPEEKLEFFRLAGAY